MAKSTFAVIHAKIQATGANEDGPYNPGARRQVLKLLKEHEWTEKEYLAECEKNSDDDRESDSDSTEEDEGDE